MSTVLTRSGVDPIEAGIVNVRKMANYLENFSFPRIRMTSRAKLDICSAVIVSKIIEIKAESVVFGWFKMRSAGYIKIGAYNGLKCLCGYS